VVDFNLFKSRLWADVIISTKLLKNCSAIGKKCLFKFVPKYVVNFSRTVAKFRNDEWAVFSTGLLNRVGHPVLFSVYILPYLNFGLPCLKPRSYNGSISTTLFGFSWRPVCNSGQCFLCENILTALFRRTAAESTELRSSTQLSAGRVFHRYLVSTRLEICNLMWFW
jgi:hypothetical protein